MWIKHRRKHKYLEVKKQECISGSHLRNSYLKDLQFVNFQFNYISLVTKTLSQQQWFFATGFFKSLPLFSAYSTPYNDAVHFVLVQLKQLWKQPLVGKFFENLPSLQESEAMITSTTVPNEQKGQWLSVFGLCNGSVIKLISKFS